VTDPRQETAYTPHGEVEYDVVTCASCGMETHRQDARAFVIGEKGTDEVDFPAAGEGWACPMCAEEDVTAFPVVGTKGGWLTVGAGAVFFPLTLALFASTDFESLGEEQATAAFWAGVLGTLIWGALGTLIWGAMTAAVGRSVIVGGIPL